MGSGIDAARAAGAGLHADVLENMRDQLMIVLLKRMADKNGHVAIPVAAVDGTGQDIVSFNVIDGVFHFYVRKKS